MTTLESIEAFVTAHHVMMLATSYDNTPYASSLFYVYDAQAIHFVVASDSKTIHMQQAIANHRVAVAIALESHMVGTLQGVQIQATIRRAVVSEEGPYFQAYPYAKVMKPELWVIEPLEMKLTDNRLGFGKKLTWKRGASE